MVIYPIMESQSDFICFYGSFLSGELGINNGDSNEINYANVEIVFVLMYQFSQRRKFNIVWCASRHPGAKAAELACAPSPRHQGSFSKSKALSTAMRWWPRPSLHYEHFRKCPRWRKHWDMDLSRTAWCADDSFSGQKLYKLGQSEIRATTSSKPLVGLFIMALGFPLSTVQHLPLIWIQCGHFLGFMSRAQKGSMEEPKAALKRPLLYYLLYLLFIIKEGHLFYYYYFSSSGDWI